MSNRTQINSALISVIDESQTEIENNTLESYSKLKEKCEKVINKIKVRKTKSIRPPSK